MDEEEIIDEKFVIKPFKLKDYAYQRNNQIHCIFKYLALVYDQMCDCSENCYYDDQIATCEGDYDSLGYVNYSPDQLSTLIEDSAFQFDSDSENSAGPIANRLLLVLKDWCRKITRIRLNRAYLYTTKLDQYNVDLLDQMVREIRLHKNIDKEQFVYLKHVTMDIEVVFTDLYHSEIDEIGMNLCYCNYLIYEFLKKHYSSCGFFLGSHPIDHKKNIPFFKKKQKINSAYCHMYLVPLNLKDYYFKKREASS